VVDAGGRSWSSFHFACGHCPRTIPAEEARARVLDGGDGALGIEVAAACSSCGHVTPYQVVFPDGGVPRFHPDRAVPDPRGASARRH
jgi:RNase P subunit RPR2